MKKMFAVALASVGIVVGVQATVYEYNGHYYEYVYTEGLTWDQASALASTMTYNGYVGQLVTLNTEGEYNFLVSTFGGGDLDNWSIAYIGAKNVSGTYTWIDGTGAVDFSGWSASPYASGQPNASYYSLTMVGTSYNSGKIGVSSAASTATLGDMIVEYVPVPEPTCLALMAVGCAAFGLRRRVKRA